LQTRLQAARLACSVGWSGPPSAGLSELLQLWQPRVCIFVSLGIAAGEFDSLYILGQAAQPCCAAWSLTPGEASFSLRPRCVGRPRRGAVSPCFFRRFDHTDCGTPRIPVSTLALGYPPALGLQPPCSFVWPQASCHTWLWVVESQLARGCGSRPPAQPARVRRAGVASAALRSPLGSSNDAAGCALPPLAAVPVLSRGTFQ